MAPSANSSSKVQILTSTLSTNETLPSDLQSDLNKALLSHGALPRIEAALRYELSASGWMDNFKARVQYLLRSGECTTYDEVMARVKREMEEGHEQAGDMSNGVNGASVNGANGVGRPVGARYPDEGGIKVPQRVVERGVEVIRKEVQKVAEIEVDDE